MYVPALLGSKTEPFNLWKEQRTFHGNWLSLLLFIAERQNPLCPAPSHMDPSHSWSGSWACEREETPETWERPLSPVQEAPVPRLLFRDVRILYCKICLNTCNDPQTKTLHWKNISLVIKTKLQIRSKWRLPGKSSRSLPLLSLYWKDTVLISYKEFHNKRSLS